MGGHVIQSLIGVLALASIHVFAGRLHGGVHVRPAWLTAASGMSVAYVFVHLLPELGEAQARWIESPYRMLSWLEIGVYIAALAGLILYVTLDRVVRRHREERFWLSVAGFAAYNAVLGGFVVRATSTVEIALGVIAFGAHFLVNDHSLQRSYGEIYERSGRWVLAAAIVLGWLASLLWRIPTLIVVPVVAFVSGGLVLNVIKEVMPERGGGRLSPWIAGAVGYTIVIVALTYSAHP